MKEFKMADDYLGDGVYASFDGYQIWLKTQTGDSIALEPKVFENLINYTKSINEKYRTEYFKLWIAAQT